MIYQTKFKLAKAAIVVGFCASIIKIFAPGYPITEFLVFLVGVTSAYMGIQYYSDKSEGRK